MELVFYLTHLATWSDPSLYISGKALAALCGKKLAYFLLENIT